MCDKSGIDKTPGKISAHRHRKRAENGLWCISAIPKPEDGAEQNVFEHAGRKFTLWRMWYAYGRGKNYISNSVRSFQCVCDSYVSTHGMTDKMDIAEMFNVCH